MDRIPIYKIGGNLLVSIQIDLADRDARGLQHDLSNTIVQPPACGVVTQIGALQLVDRFIARMRATIAAVSRVLDARTVVVGMRPAVAITLVELGLSLPGVETALDVERGLLKIAASMQPDDVDDLAPVTADDSQ